MSAKLPFTLADLRRALPGRLLEPSTPRSLAYLVADLSLLAVLVAASSRFDAWWLRPIFWLAIGTSLFSLFVIGHDCGHGSFSRHPRLNAIVGHLTNTLVLVPYHSWRLSHRIHHRFAGDIERDEAWHPLTESQLAAMPGPSRIARLHLVPFVFPLYLLRRTWGRRGSHFDPGSELFGPEDRSAVRTSVMLCALWAGCLVALALWQGLGFVLDRWAMPYLVFVVWIDVVTFLHHTDPGVPWYRGGGWSSLAGALAAVDRDYGWLAPVHHHIGEHVAHHLFPGIPHYHLRTATRALRPALGPHYRRSSEPIQRAFARSLTGCRAVPDAGDVVRFSVPLRSVARGPRRGDRPASGS